MQTLEPSVTGGEHVTAPSMPATAHRLAERIATRDAVCTVVCQGRAGFPLAEQIAAAGYTVYGFDTASTAIERCTVASQQPTYQAVHSPVVLAGSDIAIVAAPTPTRRDSAGHCPDYSALINAVRTLVRHLPDDGRARLIIVESTVPPGTTRELIAPMVAARFELGETALIGYAPSRADAVTPLLPFAEVPALTSGLDETAAYLTWLFFRQVMVNPLPAPSVEAAEAARMLEQAYRFLNIAFAREFARYCARNGVDAAEVTALAATRPSGFHAFSAGETIHSTPLADDPYYLFEAMIAGGQAPPILAAAIAEHERRMAPASAETVPCAEAEPPAAAGPEPAAIEVEFASGAGR